PFNFEWFKKKLVETLTAREAGKEKLVTFESIDLVTVLQIVNLERKTSALEIDLDDRKGIIYFEDGEIINAQYGSLQGEKAVLKLIVDTQHQGAISVKAIQGTVKRIMQEPFVEHMMKIMKTIDELRQDQLQDLEPEPVREMEPIRETDADAAPFPETGREPKAEVPISPGNNPGATPAASEFNLGPELVMDTKMPSAPEHNVSPGTLSENKNDGKNGTADQASLNKKKEVRMTINEKLAVLKDVKGYLGAGVFTPQGEMLEGVADISGVQFEEAGSLIHDTLKDAKDMAKEIGFGNLDMIQLYTQIGIVFAKCYNEGDKHFHTILVIKNDGNMAMARLKMKKVVDSLISEF
ncbi:MAG: DUF4388 domain-containing protein, partial [bacterium]|nr:DUF4388 domain-containing protein [bacterium]